MDHDRQQPNRNILISILGLAAVYYVVAYLGLLIAITPGFASPIWPAAGVALAALLLYGHRLWPGVLLGSLLINLPESLQIADFSIWQSLLFCTSVALGSSLQALLGCFLIRRAVDINSGLVEARSVILFLGLGGPLASLVSASWGIASLAVAGLIDSDQIAYNWITWWSGDCLGVLYALPLIFIFCARPRSLWAPRKIQVAVPLVVTLATIVVIFQMVSQQRSEQIETEFRGQAAILGEVLQDKVSRNFEVLYSLQQLFATADSVNRQQFKKYVERALQRNPSIYAFSWNPVVSQVDRATFEQSMRLQGFGDFTFSERDASGKLQVAGQRPNYVVIEYIEPLQDNLEVLGYDIYSNADRRTAVDLAYAGQDLIGTAPIDLIQHQESQAGVLFMLPVFGYSPHTTIVAADSDLPDGMVVGVYRALNLLYEGVAETSLTNVHIRLLDISDAANPLPLASLRDRKGLSESRFDVPEADLIDGAMQWQRILHFGNRSWKLEVIAQQDYLEARRDWVAWFVVILSLLFSALLGSFLLILSGRTMLDQQRANLLAAEIIEREKIEVALQSANESLQKIAGTDLLTQIANRRAIESYGSKLDSELRRFNTGYSILMIDIDHFKSINDRWGHETGDLVLKAFVKRIQGALRDIDFFGRWGGEEFIILVKNTPLAEAAGFGERLCHLIADSDFETVGRMTVSIGAAEHVDGEVNSDVILRADRALYRAKHTGRNCVEVDQLESKVV